MHTLHSDKLVALERLHAPKSKRRQPGKSYGLGGSAAVRHDAQAARRPASSRPAKASGDNLVQRLAMRMYDVQRRA